MIDSINPSAQNYISSSARRVERSRSPEETQSREFKLDSPTEGQAVSGLDDLQLNKLRQKDTKEPVSIERRSRLKDSDLGDLLLKYNRPVNALNKQIVTALLEHRLPITKDGLDTIRTLTEGNTRPNAVQAAVIAYSKGLSSSSKGVDLLSSYLTHYTSFTENGDALKASLSQFKYALSLNRNLFDPSLIASFSSILGGIHEDLKKLLRIREEGDFSMLRTATASSLVDLKTLLGFVKGFEQQLISRTDINAARIRSILVDLLPFKQDLEAFVDDVLTQTVLTQPESHLNVSHEDFAYFLLPNLWPQGKRDIELLVERDKTAEKKGAVNPEKTRIVLKFETPELGEVTIIMDFVSKKISYTFYTSLGDTKSYVSELMPDLQARMSACEYQLVSVQTTDKAPAEIKDLLFPRINLNAMTRIITEA